MSTRRRVLATGAACLALPGLLSLFQHRLIYFPRAYDPRVPESFIAGGGRRLDFTTRDGAQSAWLLPPANGDVAARLWICCAGNGTLALELVPFFRTLGFTEDAFLLVDYPGYGRCEGSASPAGILENLKAAVPLAAQACGIAEEQIASRTLCFGHSLGSAATLLAAEQFELRAAVLIAPFTSTMEMAKVLFRLPLGVLVRHRFDNAAGLRSLVARKGQAWLIHGDEDEVIPPGMSRSLAAIAPEALHCRMIPGGRHNNLFQSALPAIREDMAAARAVKSPA